MKPLSRDYDADPSRFLATDEHPHDDVHPDVAARFAACAPNRDSTPELAHVIPGWGTGTTFDGEDAEAIVASVFSAPGDTVETDPWDGPLVTLGSAADAAAGVAATLDLPMTLTMRGCVVYATKAESEPVRS
jgi:hypothetical protein